MKGPKLNHLNLDYPDWDKSPALSLAESTLLQATEGISLTTTPQERMLDGTNIIAWNNSELPIILLSLLRKMAASSVMDPISLSSLDPLRSYIYASRQRWEWRKVSRSVPLSIEAKIPSHFQNAFLLAELGGGGDGRVWLASTCESIIGTQVKTVTLYLYNSSCQLFHCYT